MADATNERTRRYAEAIYLASDPCGCSGPTPWSELSPSRQGWFLSVVAPPVMAVADAEQATLQEWFNAASAAAERRMDQSIKWMERAETAEVKVSQVEALVDEWDGEIGAQEDCQHPAAVRAVEACLRDLRAALAVPTECTCPEVDPSLWTTYYGAIEPGSTHEFDPGCPEHGYSAGRPMPDPGVAPAITAEAPPF